MSLNPRALDARVKVVVPKNHSWLVVLLGIIILLSLPRATALAAGTISGIAFRDFNANGVKDTNEVGLGGVTVKAYDSSNTLRGTTTTYAFSCTAAATPDASCTAANTPALGSYSLSATGTGPYRIEFTGGDSSYQPGPYAGSGTTQDHTSVQFVPDGTTANVNYGANYPQDYCQDNPTLCAPSYTNGSSTISTTLAALYEWDYNASGLNDPSQTQTADKENIGTTWGEAYARGTKDLYLGAYLKRHSGIGPGDGISSNPYGAIYVRDTSGAGQPTYFATIPNAGTVVRTDLAGPLVANHDTEAYTATAKIGLGGMAISEDEKTLYVMNLNDRSLYTVDIATATPSASGVAVPDPCAGTGVSRPFAVQYWHGLVYIGIICDASISNLKTDLNAYVYTFDPATSTFAGSPVFTGSMNFTKGEVVNCTSGTYNYGYWPWSNDPADLSGADFFCRPSGASGNPHIEVHPMPILSDIQFDVDGSLMLGFTDRFGTMLGWRNWGPDTTSTQLYDVIIGGDVLRACPTTPALTAWNFEVNGSCGGVTTAGAGNTQGPGGGEFYFGDQTAPDPSQKESAEGGMAFIPGTGEIATTAQDPNTSTNAQGVIRMSNSTGAKNHGYQLYVNSTADSLVPEFGKANGLGDLVALCDAAPIEIGNRVWNDVNANGVQDAGEPTFSGVTVHLYDAGNNLVGTTTTDANGQYYFNNSNVTNADNTVGIKPLTAYTIRLDNAADYQSGGPLYQLALTQAFATGTNINTANDSNAVLPTPGSPIGTGNYPEITVTYLSGNTLVNTTGLSGFNNHTFDAGFTATYSLGNRVFLDTNNNGVFDTGSGEINAGSGITVNLIAAIKVTIGNTTYNAGDVIATTTTDANGYYRFDGLPASQYKTQLDKTDFSPGGPLAGYLSSTGAQTPSSSMPDSHDTGIDEANPPANGITSGVVTLGPGNQPTATDFTTPPPAAASTYGPDIPVANNNLNMDFGLYRLTVAGVVWNDNGAGGGTANNGLLDGTEAGIFGVTVDLYKGATLVAVTTTDSNGNYFFNQQTDGSGNPTGAPLQPGTDYTLRIPSAQVPLTGMNSSTDVSTTPNPTNNGNGFLTDDNGTGTALADTNTTTTDAFTLDVTTASNTAGSVATNANGTTTQPTIYFGFYATTTGVEVSSLSATSTGATQAQVDWTTQDESKLAGFNVLRSTSAQNGFKAVNSALITAKNPGVVLGNDYRFTDSGITAGTPYYYQLELVHLDNSKTLSQVVSIDGSNACAAKPNAALLLGPANKAKVNGARQNLTWNAAACATSYRLQVRVNNKAGRQIAQIRNLTNPHYTIKGLQLGVSYVWRIKACDSAGCATSKWWSFTIAKP